MSKEFYENLKNAREKCGYTQKEVAEKIQVAKSTYSLYESGKREPGVPIIKKLAHILDTSADQLIGIESTHTETIAAHKENGESWTPKELEKIEEYKKLLLAARSHKMGDD